MVKLHENIAFSLSEGEPIRDVGKLTPEVEARMREIFPQSFADFLAEYGFSFFRWWVMKYSHCCVTNGLLEHILKSVKRFSGYALNCSNIAELDKIRISYMRRPVIPAFFFILVAIFIEISGFVIVGSRIGVLATLGLIIMSMVVGVATLRHQGGGLLTRIQAELVQGRAPEREMAEGAVMVVAAILLIIPGFVSSIIGLLLFIPAIRQVLWNVFSKRFTTQTSFYTNNARSGHGKDEKTIDLDAEDYHSSDPENSPWRQLDDQKMTNDNK